MAPEAIADREVVSVWPAGREVWPPWAPRGTGWPRRQRPCPQRTLLPRSRVLDLGFEGPVGGGEVGCSCASADRPVLSRSWRWR